jgi:F-box-like
MVFPRVTIGSLPEDVLLDIFDFYRLVTMDHEYYDTWSWQRLVHVCRRWRYVVFASPVRLDLQLLITPTLPVRKLLDIWPALPLNIGFDSVFRWRRCYYDNLIAATEHRDRVRQIDLDVTCLLWEEFATAMQEPFPAMISLRLVSDVAFHVPDTFLSGSAPCLQRLALRSISFPSLPRLLLSASNLTVFDLSGIPNTGYVSPEAMVTCLSALPKLKRLEIGFEFSTPDPKRRNRPLPPSTRTVLPALTFLRLQGDIEYLEVLAALIDAPLLHQASIIFFRQPAFDIPQLSRFVGHLEFPRSYSLFLDFSSCVDARIYCSRQRHMDCMFGPGIAFDWRVLSCRGLGQQVFSVAQICSQISYLCSSLESLTIVGRNYQARNRRDDMDPTLWLKLFRSFTSVQSLDISANLEPFIAAALQGLTGESAAEVLPALHTLSIVGHTSDSAAQQDIESFISTRQNSDHPVAVHRSNRWTLGEVSGT